MKRTSDRDNEVTVQGQGLSAIVLAADRTGNDPVSAAAGTACKALATVAGRAMVLRVLDALRSCKEIRDIILCGPARQAIGQLPELAGLIEGGNIHHVANRETLAGSVDAALQTATEERVLITSADCALLDAETAAYFLQRCRESTADICTGMVRYNLVRSHYPDVKRTVMKFSNGGFCGCNLYCINTAAGRDIVNVWSRAAQYRKSPWRVVHRLFGSIALLRYLAGRLSVTEARRVIRTRTGLDVSLIEIPFARAGIDVDTVADWRLAEAILRDDHAAG